MNTRKISIITIILLLTTFFVYAQDTKSRVPDSILPNTGLSDDGKFVWSECINYPKAGLNTLVLKETNGPWRKEIADGTAIFFTNDDKHIIVTASDSLYVVNLGQEGSHVIATHLISVKSPAKSPGIWLAFNTQDSPGTVILYDFLSKNMTRYNDAIDYQFDDSGNTMLLKKLKLNGNMQLLALEWVNLISGTSKEIWQAPNSRESLAMAKDDKCFDQIGSQLVFEVTDSTHRQLEHSIWYYNPRKDVAEPLVQNKDIESGFEIAADHSEYFTPAGQNVVFHLLKIDTLRKDPKLEPIDVWSYQDPILQSQQLIKQSEKERRKYTAVIPIMNRKVLRIESEYDYLLPESTFLNRSWRINDDDALICKFKYDVFNGAGDQYFYRDATWNKIENCAFYLVSLKGSGTKMLVDSFQMTYSGAPLFFFSKNGKFVIYYHAQEKNYYSYEISTGLKRNLTAKINSKWYDGSSGQAEGKFYMPSGFYQQTWLMDGTFLIKDHFNELWRLDPSGKKAPINVTNGFAKANHIVWNLMNADGVEAPIEVDADSFFETWTDGLSVRHGKYEGAQWYKKTLGQPGNPELVLKSHPYLISGLRRAKKSKTYLLQRELLSTTKPKPPVDYYFTNFNDIHAVTDYSKSNLKGIQKEVIVYKTLGGQWSSGLLVKPPQYDPTKRYPVLFVYYNNVWWERPNFELVDGNKKSPILRRDFADDYLCFYPAIINGKAGERSDAVYNSIMAAAQAIMKRTDVDARHLGIRGHSFGGYETNILLTRTHLFAAAFSSSGFTDLVSMFGGREMDAVGFSQRETIETGQLSMAVTPWQRPDLYLKNSPIFYADRVTTPVLFEANMDDTRVPASQGIELFMALCRLGKRAWLLDANNKTHGTSNTTEYMAAQFFDHYLRGFPTPLWMTRGVPARLKGTTLGLDYDLTVKTPGPGLTIDNPQAMTPRQKELLKHRTAVNKDGRIVDVRDKTPIEKND